MQKQFTGKKFSLTKEEIKTLLEAKKYEEDIEAYENYLQNPSLYDEDFLCEPEIRYAEVLRNKLICITLLKLADKSWTASNEQLSEVELFDEEIPF